MAEKLHPDHFSAMSGKMAAIIGYVLGESRTEPEIKAMSVTSDGYVTSESEFLGEAADLDRNILNLLVAADLSDEERSEFERLGTGTAWTTGDPCSRVPRACDRPTHSARLRGTGRPRLTPGEDLVSQPSMERDAFGRFASISTVTSPSDRTQTSGKPVDL
ncbi:MAG: hypothetical protein M5T61_09130 [Acidimicrobiia bacterium]|nr:hypothetical protein [Acidimicrobiia bacterium]